jgi:hypothetical protein
METQLETVAGSSKVFWIVLLRQRLVENPLFAFKNFRRFFIGRMISAVGDKFFTLAVAGWVIAQGG